MKFSQIIACAVASVALVQSAVTVRSDCGHFRCTQDYVPVCGSNGQTYSNKCVFEMAQCRSPTLTLVKSTACGDVEKQNLEALSKVRSDCGRKMCLQVEDPVCGSNGQTYSNQCVLEVAQCHDPSIKLAKTGSCADTA